MSNPELVKLARYKIQLLSDIEKQAFVPADQLGMGAGGMPPGAGGMPPGAGGMPPGMDPAAMAGAMPPGMPPDPAMAGAMPPGADPMMGGAMPPPPPGGGAGQVVQVSIDDLRMIMMEAVQGAMMLQGQGQPAAPAGPEAAPAQEEEGGGKGEGGGESNGLEQRISALEQMLGGAVAPMGAAPPMDPAAAMGGGMGGIAAPPAPTAGAGMTVAAAYKSNTKINDMVRALLGK